MPSIGRTLRDVALTAALAGAAVVAAAAPSSAIDPIRVNTEVVRDVIEVDPLPDVGELVDAGDLPSCDTQPVSYCMEVGSPVLGPFAVPSVEYDTVHVTDVDAYVDTYDASVGSLGTELFTCVSLVKPTIVDPCGLLGFPRLSRTPLVAQPVDAFIPRQGDQPLTTVTVCSAQIIVNDGALRSPAFTVC